MLKAAAAARRSGAATNYGLWLDGRPVSSSEDYLAIPEDGSLAAYVDRATSKQAQREFCLAHFNLQAFDVSLWHRAAEFLHPLFEIVGVPHDDVDLDTFLGRYRTTPRGIHTDPAGTFMFVVAGHKRIIVWPPDALSPREYEISGGPLQRTVQALAPGDAPGGTVLEGVAGDVLYWPSTYWHVGVASRLGELTAAVNLGVFMGGRTRPAAATVVQSVLDQCFFALGGRATYRVPAEMSASARSGLPAAESSLLDILTDALQRGLIEDILIEHWLNRVTAYGFSELPPLAVGAQLEDGDLLEPSIPCFYRCARLRDGDLLISAGGRSRRVQWSRAILDLLASISTSRSVTWACEGSDSETADPAIKEIVEWLVAVRALGRSGGQVS